eukprot:CAMPEP_0204237808 /NCGR_PEP_ID=MMETSP0361-20130328/93533_1 /ASSEMBLY_ACC=CAM_ASM_000343 /TAXON_ID=268821 /ORGANISM="Scrippsiella Hangoei, Strain SHTV-5" /LENGTH=43 /DNA_ID= /DNA_START= /DNA_END= /DNA_ORIENTATION=
MGHVRADTEAHTVLHTTAAAVKALHYLFFSESDGGKTGLSKPV